MGYFAINSSTFFEEAWVLWYLGLLYIAKSSLIHYDGAGLVTLPNAKYQSTQPVSIKTNPGAANGEKPRNLCSRNGIIQLAPATSAALPPWAIRRLNSLR